MPPIPGESDLLSDPLLAEILAEKQGRIAKSQQCQSEEDRRRPVYAAWERLNCYAYERLYFDPALRAEYVSRLAEIGRAIAAAGYAPDGVACAEGNALGLRLASKILGFAVAGDARMVAAVVNNTSLIGEPRFAEAVGFLRSGYMKWAVLNGRDLCDEDAGLRRRPPASAGATVPAEEDVEEPAVEPAEREPAAVTAQTEGQPALTGGDPPRKKFTRTEAERLVDAFLKKNAGRVKRAPFLITIDEVEKSTGVPRSSIHRTDAWTGFNDDREKRNRRGRTAGRVRQVELGERLIATVPANVDDPATKVEVDEFLGLPREKQIELLAADQKDDLDAEDRSHRRRAERRGRL